MCVTTFILRLLTPRLTLLLNSQLQTKYVGYPKKDGSKHSNLTPEARIHLFVQVELEQKKYQNIIEDWKQHSFSIQRKVYFHPACRLTPLFSLHCSYQDTRGFCHLYVNQIKSGKLAEIDYRFSFYLLDL